MSITINNVEYRLRIGKQYKEENELSADLIKPFTISAWFGKRNIGNLIGTMWNNEVTITELHVEEEYRNTGVGSRLIRLVRKFLGKEADFNYSELPQTSKWIKEHY